MELHTINSPEYPNWFQLYRTTWAVFSWYDLHLPSGQSDTAYMVDPATPGYFCDPYRWCGNYVAIDSFLDTNWDGVSRGVCDPNRNYFYTVVVVETLLDGTGRRLYSPVSPRPVGEFDFPIKGNGAMNIISYPLQQNRLPSWEPITSANLLGQYIHYDMGIPCDAIAIWNPSEQDTITIARRVTVPWEHWEGTTPVEPGGVYIVYTSASSANGLIRFFCPGYVPFDSSYHDSSWSFLHVFHVFPGGDSLHFDLYIVPYQVYNYLLDISPDDSVTGLELWNYILGWRPELSGYNARIYRWNNLTQTRENVLNKRIYPGEPLMFSIWSPPSCPTVGSFTSTPYSSHKIQLSWTYTGGGNPDSIFLWRIKGADTLSIARLQGCITSYIDTGLNYATRYWYKITSWCNSMGISSTTYSSAQTFYFRRNIDGFAFRNCYNQIWPMTGLPAYPFPDWETFVFAYGPEQVLDPYGNPRPGALEFYNNIKGYWRGSCFGFSCVALHLFASTEPYEISDWGVSSAIEIPLTNQIRRKINGEQIRQPYYVSSPGTIPGLYIREYCASSPSSTRDLMLT